ncbi:MAG: hypothetical protein QOF71_3272 [Candidatus Eremiobacteraeota bacterium]|jgi:hypothetical protein|nr:hypothetical protein [Candidatus Eremiobacteraeota bacterium]
MLNIRNAARAIALAVSFVAVNGAIASALPIDTGYDYTNYAPYPAAPGNPAPSSITDKYWINIASFPTIPVSPAYVIDPNLAWLTYPGSRWIGPRNVWNSNATTNNPYYSIFKKCFCLAPHFNSASLSFRVRNDDNMQIWLNTVLDTLIGPIPGNYNSGGASVVATQSQLSYLHAGKNCIYALLEDTGTAMGFDLTGNFNANGLYPYAAAGVDGTFPCACDAHPGPVPNSAGNNPAARLAMPADDDREVVNAIIKIAEARHRAKLKTQ